MNIRKIAEKAGVSVATISRVLNHPEIVSPETRERVYSVMRDNQYTPNWFARNLTQKQSRTIAFLSPSDDSDFLHAVASGIETVALNKKNLVFSCHFNNNANSEESNIGLVLERNVDGIIILTSEITDEIREALKQKTIPCVFIGREALGEENTCYINYEDAAYKLTEHMLHLGHSQIYLLLDNLMQNEAKEIKSGFAGAVLKSGKKIDTEFFVADRTFQGGFLFAQKMIQMKKLPRALITSSSRQAFGVIKAVRAAGIRIPEEFAIASMTDSPVSSLIEPPLTAVDRPGKRLGMVAARMLYDCIENREFAVKEPQNVELLAKLAIRKSCGNRKFIYELFE